MTGDGEEHRFICDRMAGSLCRYLRLMGYDTLSANDLPRGNPREDTQLLFKAREEKRLILTRDAELAHRDQDYVLYLTGGNIRDQITQMIRAGLIIPSLRLNRCSLCNSRLVPIDPDNLLGLKVKFPEFNHGNDPVFWCNTCRKAYWEGSHTGNLRGKLAAIAKDAG